MTGRTHDMISFAAILTAASLAPPQQLNLYTTVSCLVGGVVGALIPDMDQATNRLWDMLPAGNFVGKILRRVMLGHRTLSHSLLGLYIFYKFLFFAVFIVKVLILAPTRELASQIRSELVSYSQGINIYSALCIGGANIWRQKESLRRNPNFVIGTPGRLEDLVKTRDLNLSYFDSVVLDEADHMVDIGFIENIKRMINLLPKNRQSLFFSATVNDKIKVILQSFVTNPVTVSVKSRDITANVKQEMVKIIPPNTKIAELERMLKNDGFKKILIFGRTKHGVQKLSETLIDRGFKADAIHGNKNQSQRIRTLDKFKNDYIQILIATDVASRGLDIPNVSHVINYDLPESYESYIHRIGRTGRAENTGTALTFIEH